MAEDWTAAPREHIAGGILLFDVSDLLPRRQMTPKITTRTGAQIPRLRTADKIDRLFVHHSGRAGRAGFDGVRNSARYTFRVRGFWDPPYTFWIPRDPVRVDGDLAFFRCNPDMIRSWHTGGRANDRGVAFAFQGNAGKQDLTASQIEIAEALIPWAADRYRLAMPRALQMHSEAGSKKPTCPGRYAAEWVRAYRAAS